MEKQVALLVDKTELSDIRMGLMHLHSTWLTLAEEEFVGADNVLKDIRSLQDKVRKVMENFS